MLELPIIFKPVENLKGAESTQRWLEKNYHRLDNGGFEYLGHEPNTDTPEKWDTADLRVLVIRLSTYQAVDASMTHSLLGQILRRGSNTFVDHCYLPPRKDYELFVENSIAPWFGATSKRPARDFDLLVVSHSVCMERLNLPRLMVKSGIPLFKPLRMGDESVPLIIMGGANSYSVEDLYGSWDGSDEHSCLLDATVVGAGEYSLAQIRDVVTEGKKKKLSKQEILNNCHGRVEGFYEPDKYLFEYAKNSEGLVVLSRISRKASHVALPVVKAKVISLDKVATLEEGVVFYTGGNGGAADIEIARGCPAQCSFCQECWVTKPYQERSLASIESTAIEAKKRQGATEMNLYSFNWNHYSKIYDLVKLLMQEHGHINLISNRLDVQCQDPALATLMKAAGVHTTTVGIEGCSERMRRFMHKSLTEGMILSGINYLMAAGFAEIKGFMICSGYETDEDIKEFCALLRRVNQLRQEMGYGTQFRISFMPIFTAAGSPLQFYSCESAWQIKQRTLDQVVTTCRQQHFGFRTGSKRAEIEISQLLEMADRRLTPLVLRASLEDEYVFYGLVPAGYRDKWEARLKEAGLSWDVYFREKHVSDILPWDHIYCGVSKDFLWRRYAEALGYVDDGYCLSMLRKKGKCTACGGCPTTKHMKDITVRQVNQPLPLEEVLLSKRSTLDVRPTRFLLEVKNPMLRSVPKKFWGQALGRAIMLSDPILEKAWLKMKSHSRITAAINDQKDWVYGQVVIDMGFNNAEVTENLIRKRLQDINKHLWGAEILDVKVADHLRQLRLDLELALYQVNFEGLGAPSYHKVTQGVEAYFRSLIAEQVVTIAKNQIIHLETQGKKGITEGKISWSDLSSIEEKPPVVVTFFDTESEGRERLLKGVVQEMTEHSLTLKVGGLKIKKRIVATKGAFKTVEVDLDRSKVVMVNASFTGEGTRLVFLADNRLNPYSLLETLLGGKQWQYRPYPVKVLGYFNRSKEKKGEVTVDLRELLKTKVSGPKQSSVCCVCGGSIETNAFTGELFVSEGKNRLCIACSFNDALPLEEEE